MIETARLSLVPLTLEMVEAATHDKGRLGQLISMRVPPAWPGADFEEVLPIVADGLRSNPAYSDWTRIIAHKSDGAAIGSMGFLQMPDETGTVEIGYGLIPDYRGYGYATEAAKALVEWALAQPGVRRVVAECNRDNTASVRVLEKLGMHRLSDEDEPIKWELMVERPPEP